MIFHEMSTFWICCEALPDVAAKPPADVEAEPEESAVSETNFCVLHTKWTRWWPTQACSSQSVMNLILRQCDTGIHHFMTTCSCLFYPGPFIFWDLCTYRRMRATIYTIERPLLSSWSMPISVWSLGCPILLDSWSRELFLFGGALRGWNRPQTLGMIAVWRKQIKQGRNLRKVVSTLHCWNLFFFNFGGRTQVAKQLKIFGWLDIAIVAVRSWNL